MKTKMDNRWTGLDSRQAERIQLKRDANYIGTGMVFLSLLLNLTFTVILIPLILAGAVDARAVASNELYLGMGNTKYMLVYAVVYATAMGLPMILSSLLFRQPLNPFRPHKKVGAGTAIPALLLGMAMCMAANLVASSVMSFLSMFGIKMPDMPSMLEHTPVSLLLNLLVIAVLPALLEEMMFRGYILQVLRPYGDGMAILVSSLLFGLMHGNVLQIPFAILVGLALCYIVVQTDNIWLAVGLHFLNNAFSVLLDYFTMGMPEAESSKIITLAFLIIGAVGLLSTLIAVLSRSRLLHPLKPSRSALRPGERADALFSSPLFLLGIGVFVLSTLLTL